MKRLAYIREYGDGRCYFQRHRRGRKIRIYERPGTQAFIRVYQDLLASEAPAPRSAPRPLMRTDGAGFVYFLKAGGDIKIGFSTEPTSRIQGLKVGMPVAIEMLVVVPGTRRDERALHAELTDDRLSGEWFKASRKVRDVMLRSAALGRPAIRTRTERRPGHDSSGVLAENIQ